VRQKIFDTERSIITAAGHDANNLLAVVQQSSGGLHSSYRPHEKNYGTKSMDKLLSNSEILLTTAAVARWLGISTRAVCLWAECEEIPAIKVGRQWRFRQDELRDWLQNVRDAKVRKGTPQKSFQAGA
jgi:excisionase family DNA binding protein